MVLSTMESSEMVNSMEKAYWLLQKKTSFMVSSIKTRKMVRVFNLEKPNSVLLEMSTKAISLMAFEMD